jgi:hypothetical protein
MIVKVKGKIISQESITSGKNYNLRRSWWFSRTNLVGYKMFKLYHNASFHFEMTDLRTINIHANQIVYPHESMRKYISIKHTYYEIEEMYCYSRFDCTSR